MFSMKYSFLEVNNDDDNNSVKLTIKMTFVKFLDKNTYRFRYTFQIFCRKSLGFLNRVFEERGKGKLEFFFK